MNRLLLLLVIPLLLAGCEIVNNHDRAVLRAHNVPGYLNTKMHYGDPLSPDDVIVLSQCGVPSGLIIHYLDVTGIAYRLREVDVDHLRGAGVSEPVIATMLSMSAPHGPGPYAGPYPPAPYPGPYPYPYYPNSYYDGAPAATSVVVVGGGGGGGYRGSWGGFHGGWRR